MEKDSNKRIFGLPEYLDSFKYRPHAQTKQIAKSILSGTFDLREEREYLKAIEKQVKDYGKAGGPLSEKELKAYPGHDEFI
jgi:hypothetical protein